MQEYVFDYSTYKKRLEKPINFGFSILSLVIIFLLGICVFLKQNKTEYIEYYFVEIGQFKTFSQANKMANELSSKSGAGFVFFDDCYHVLAGFYNNQENAKTVSSNISEEYQGAKIFSISATKFKAKRDFTSTQNKSLRSMLEYNDELITELYNLSINIEKNTETFNAAILKVKNLKEEHTSNFKQFKANFNGKNEQLNLKKKLNEIQNSLSHLTNCNEQDIKQKIKYELINIVVLQCNILNEIG